MTTGLHARIPAAIDQPRQRARSPRPPMRTNTSVIKWCRADGECWLCCSRTLAGAAPGNGFLSWSCDSRPSGTPQWHSVHYHSFTDKQHGFPKRICLLSIQTTPTRNLTFPNGAPNALMLLIHSVYHISFADIPLARASTSPDRIPLYLFPSRPCSISSSPSDSPQPLHHMSAFHVSRSRHYCLSLLDQLRAVS